jgi:hypothetical protein
MDTELSLFRDGTDLERMLDMDRGKAKPAPPRRIGTVAVTPIYQSLGTKAEKRA